MEVSELNVFLSDFEAGVNCLQNPSLLSRVPISDLRKLPQFNSLLKWGALILALVATFTGLIRRIKLLIFRFCKITLLAFCRSPTQKLQVHCGYDENDDDSCSVSSADDDYVPTTSLKDQGIDDEDCCVAGSSSFLRSRSRELKFRRRTGSFEKLFSWSDFAGGRSVVKLWDSLGLSFDLEDDEESSNGVVSIWDLNRDEKISSFSDRSYQFGGFSASSPAMIFSAGSGVNKKTLLDIYDTRIGSRFPAIIAEWKPMDGEVIGISSGGVEKVYVRDDNSGTVTVGDMRNVKAPLEAVTVSSGEQDWWDADAVILPDEYVVDDES